MKYIIIDWANNICFDKKEFDHFEDAWSYIYEYFDDLPEDEKESAYEEFEVIKKEEL